MSFKKYNGNTDAEKLALALTNSDTKIDIISPDGHAWRLCNETASKCQLHVTHVVVKDDLEIRTTFVVNALNGKILQ